jgi:exopolyphosphatase / guanosine-5'-triphosphate,3'-diphosphate pyrophosphatase
VRCACIDIGSNTTRLLVAQAAGNGLRELHQERAFTGIGRAIDADGMISPAKIAEVAVVVSRLLQIARTVGAGEVRAVATAAVRRAANGEALAQAVTDACGLIVRVLSEQEEARLAFVGAAHALGPLPDGELGVADVGGGSTELAVGAPPDRVRWSASLAIGSGELTERLLPSDPPTREQLHAAHSYVGEVFAELNVPHPARAVAVGGSATSLRRLTGGRLAEDTFRHVMAKLTRGPSDAIALGTGLDPERVRLLPAGLLLLDAVVARFGVPLEVGCGGIREAIVLETIAGVPVPEP